MLTTTDLTYQYENSKPLIFPAISCSEQKPLLLLGNSGSGKTTLLHLLGLILTPTSGTIELDGTNVGQLSPAEKTLFRAKEIGIIFQKPHFISSLTVLDNLLIPNYLSNKTLQKEKAKALAKELGFEALLHKKTYSLSGGEQQRVSIARAVMNTPKVVLADEPTSSLDDKNCEKVIGLLTTQAAQAHATLIIVTHDQRLKSRFENHMVLK